MSTDVILALLVLAILSNVVLLVAAIRHGVLRDGLPTDWDRGVPREIVPAPDLLMRNVERLPRPPRGTPPVRRLVDLAIPLAPAVRPTRALPPAPTAAPDRVDALATAVEAAPPPSGDVVLPVPPASVASTDASSAGAGPTPRPKRAPARRAVDAAPSAGRAARPRRFTLPPIDVDHARTEQAVLSLLGTPAARGRRERGPAEAAPAHPAAVVAVSLEGAGDLAENEGRAVGEQHVAVVLDALRRAARAADRVAVVGPGRFRIILGDADGDAADRYVRRVLSSVERRLAVAPAPLRLATGVAIGPADSLDRAVVDAEERRRIDATEGAKAREQGSTA